MPIPFFIFLGYQDTGALFEILIDLDLQIG